MADENNPGTPDGGTPAATPADAGAAPLLNYKEVVELRKETRETRELLKQFIAAQQSGRSEQPVSPAPPVPAPAKATKTEPHDGAADAAAVALAQVNELRREIAVKDALLSAGITDPKAQRLIAAAVKAENPQDVGAFIADFSGLVRPPTPAAAPAAPAPKPVTPPINTGAPNTTGTKADVLDLTTMDSATFNALPQAERVRLANEMRSRGPNSNPYAGARVRELTRPGKK